MPGVGVEPTCLTAVDLKSTAATNYATRAGNTKGLTSLRPRWDSHPRIAVLQTAVLTSSPLGRV